MEAKTKIIAAVAVIVMCAAGLVGAGYAYTATTVNDGNSASSEYITLVQGGTGAYDFAEGKMIYWDSADHKVRAGDPLITSDHKYTGTETSVVLDDLVTRYTLADQVNVDAITGHKVVKVGDEFTLNPVYSTTTNLPEITIAIGGNENFDMPTMPATAEIWIKTTCNAANQYFKLKGDNGQFTEQIYNAGWHDGTGANITVTSYQDNQKYYYYPVSVEVFYGFTDANYEVGVLAKHAAGAAPATKPQEQILNNAALTFAIDVDKHNQVLVLDAYSGSVAKDASNLVINATLPVGWTDDIHWESTNTSIATVSSATGASINVTGVAAGSTTITVSVTHEQHEYTAVFTVEVTNA